ncbi:hypothetical protein [uncultured Tateyamaria sp.]|uniref:hypothetical protein n=1 Tax=uncultured Tateyamaria sp. TaxID=455651 RepID=UPI00262915D4|nr:hypothetical protein [uncultured Tateyamaria sp.]
MPTTRVSVSTEWTDLGTGPLTAFQSRNRVWYQSGDVAPTDPRTGYLHAAQGQPRPVSFTQATNVWARAVEAETPIMVVSGALASNQNPTTLLVFELYSQLPDPTTQDVGTIAFVTADPVDVLNGGHVVLGASPGAKGTYWGALS